MDQLLQSTLVEPYASAMMWTHLLVKDCTQKAGNSHELDAKKQRVHPYSCCFSQRKLNIQGRCDFSSMTPLVVTSLPPCWMQTVLA